MSVVKKSFDEMLYVMGGVFLIVIVMNLVLPIDMFKNFIFYFFFAFFYFLGRCVINARKLKTRI